MIQNKRNIPAITDKKIMHDLCKLGATSIEILDFTFKVLKAKMSIYLNGGIHKKILICEEEASPDQPRPG